MLNLVKHSIKSCKIAKNSLLEQNCLNKYFFIINPNAGYGRAHKEWYKLAKLIDGEDIIYELEFTKYVGHAKEITIEKIEQGFRKFIVFGGDGTLNEVVNGIFRQNIVPTTEIYLGIFSMGTGNDWAKYYNFSAGYADSIERIKNGEFKRQDVGKIVHGIEGEQKSSYFINVAGLCFDSVVVKATNEIKKQGKRTRMGYLGSLLKSLITYKPCKLRIFINDEILEGIFLSISIGIGKFSGGGMQQTPDAVIDDGYFDVTIYSNMSKFVVLANVSKLYNGKILEVKGVKSYKVKSLRIEPENEIFAEIDGEIIGTGPYKISILHNSINILV